MKLDAKLVLGLLGSLILMVLGFIGNKVWEGVEIARDNRVELSHVKETVSELKTQNDILREELTDLWKNSNALAQEVP